LVKDGRDLAVIRDVQEPLAVRKAHYPVSGIHHTEWDMGSWGYLLGQRHMGCQAPGLSAVGSDVECDPVLVVAHIDHWQKALLGSIKDRELIQPSLSGTVRRDANGLWLPATSTILGAI
jgi:hypothetical protein